jgi:3-phosphoshikimate 1-carboxyvinyltransferase
MNVSRQYPDKLEIVPLTKPPHATVRVPGSKSITNRALVLAALTPHCKIECASECDDADVMAESLRRLGFSVVTDRDRQTVIVDRQSDLDSADHENLIPRDRADLFVSNSGTTMRFLTALVSLGKGTYRLDGAPRMRERPISDLLDVLQKLGVNARSEFGNGRPPIIIDSPGLSGGTVGIRGDVSSQFLSGLLLVAPFARGETRIHVDGKLVSQPYIWMTLELMRSVGLEVEMQEYRTFRIPGRQNIWVTNLQIEPDASAASYFFAAAAIARGSVSVPGLTKESLQGDFRFADIVEEMGCVVVREIDCLTVNGHLLHAIDADMNDISDCVPTLAAVACFAEGPTTIRNVAHIRHKESDRISAMATELRKVGAEVEEFPDGLRITPRPLHGAEIDTYNDHRIAMSMALIGLKVTGIVIKNPGCVAKTYPGYWDDLEKLRN